MKTYNFVFYSLLLILFSSFEISEECEYAGSNMGFVKTQTQRAISATDVNESHFRAYKALNALEKSQDLFDDCGCTDALDYMKDALENLKMATRANTLEDTRLLLNKSLENTISSIEAIEEHDEHSGSYGTDILVLNSETHENENPEDKTAVDYADYSESLKQKIDISLISYEASLQTVVETVNCKEAYAFAKRVFDHCEAELLRNDLSEGKKYYNLKTKAITKKALDQLGECHAK